MKPFRFLEILGLVHGRTLDEIEGLAPTMASLSVYCFSTFLSVNVGDYIQAVLDRNLAENISRVLYPNDNVSNAGPAWTAYFPEPLQEPLLTEDSHSQACWTFKLKSPKFSQRVLHPLSLLPALILFMRQDLLFSPGWPGAQ